MATPKQWCQLSDSMARTPGYRNMVTNTYQTRKRWIRACKSRLADTAESGAPILPFSAHSATMSDLPVQLERIFSTTQHGDLESYYCRLSEVSFFLLLISKNPTQGGISDIGESASPSSKIFDELARRRPRAAACIHRFEQLRE